jgi:iron(III) transport system ATP-binding protein
MVFQNYAVWPHKTVFENVVFGLKLRRVPTAAAKKQVETALSLVNLSGLEGRYPNELSGGQQQRVALARSLVVEPSILLLDEPLSNLDAKLRERMRTELKELQRRTGITFVYVTHDQAEALALSDHVAVMSGGRLQQYGTPFEVYAHPANRMVADFMGLVNLVPGKVRALANGGGTVELSPDFTLDVAALDGLKPGEGVDIAIRPENIRLTALASEASGQRGDSQVHAHIASEDARERADDTRPVPGSSARAAPAGAATRLAKITNQVFLGNINEYYATLSSGQVLRVQTHPLQQFKIGEEVAIEVDATQCSVFRRAMGDTT